MQNYFPASYFPPTYFGLAGVDPGAPPPVAVGHDWDIMEDIQTRLEATGQFDGVHLTGPPTYQQVAASEDVTAWLQLVDWDEDDSRDDLDNVEVTRRVHWTLTIAVRFAEGERRDRELSRLTSVAQNALNGKSLAGITLPGLTRLRRGRFDEPNTPERRTIITGEFLYLIEGFGGHDAADA